MRFVSRSVVTGRADKNGWRLSVIPKASAGMSDVGSLEIYVRVLPPAFFFCSFPFLCANPLSPNLGDDGAVFVGLASSQEKLTPGRSSRLLRLIYESLAPFTTRVR